MRKQPILYKHKWRTICDNVSDSLNSVCWLGAESISCYCQSACLVAIKSTSTELMPYKLFGFTFDMVVEVRMVLR